MPTLIRCSACRKQLRVPDNQLGRTVRCPACQATFIAKAEDDEPTIAAIDEESEPSERLPGRQGRVPSLMGPGIGMIVVGALEILAAAIVLFIAYDLSRAGQVVPGGQNAYLWTGCGTMFAGLVHGGILILGGSYMLRLRNYGSAMIAAVTALVPCTCLVLSLPFGIWGIVVLVDPKVKDAFRRKIL
jgi:predicted Zn finger-like uncharacterized protein